MPPGGINIIIIEGLLEGIATHVHGLCAQHHADGDASAGGLVGDVGRSLEPRLAEAVYRGRGTRSR